MVRPKCKDSKLVSKSRYRVRALKIYGSQTNLYVLIPRQVTRDIKKRLTIKNCPGRPARVDRNHKLSACPSFLQILGVMLTAMELTQQEQPAFDTGAFFGQPFDVRFDLRISKSQN
jgi:hypothetical protein